VKTFWFYKYPGIKIFFNVGNEYKKLHGVFPTTATELPNYLREVGFDVCVANEKPPAVQRERIGLTMEDDVATALVLKYG
jgi:hypothetical protein